MNGYDLSRQWFDFAFENPDLVCVTQSALYMWLIEANNRAGFSEKFAFSTEDACRAIGVSNRKTVWKALNELSEIGFVNIIFKSSNQRKPSVISLKVKRKTTSGALDKSLISLSKKRTTSVTAEEQLADYLGNSSETPGGHSYKQQTTNNKPITNDFEIFWEAYDKKVDRAKCEKKWESLTQNKRDLALENVKAYVQVHPDKKFRKDPIRYLTNENWNDELPAPKPEIRRQGVTYTMAEKDFLFHGI